MLFELLHLVAQGALGHRQFLPGLDETQVPGHRLEGAQTQQGREIGVQWVQERRPVESVLMKEALIKESRATGHGRCDCALLPLVPLFENCKP
jgi:hypothetical protein